MTIAITVVESSKRSSRRSSGFHRAEATRSARTELTRSLVDIVRQAVRQIVSTGEDGRELALALVEQHWARLDSSCPLQEDLRPWQLLASDLAAALSAEDPARAERATTVAEQIRTTVTIMARNPLEELALRPASRRVLVAIHELGGRADASQVRERCGHSGPHLSNILSALRGHGLVAMEPAKDDRRKKVLTLTRRGEAEIARNAAHAGTHTSFRSNLRLARSAPTDEAYPQELRSLEETF